MGDARAPPILVFDIGGTNVRAALYEPSTSRLIARLQAPSPNFLNRPGQDAEALFQEVLGVSSNLGRVLLCGRRPAAVVVGYPGPVDSAGVALRSPTIFGPELDGPVQVSGGFEGVWPGAPIKVLNDLSCSGYRYVDRGLSDFCIFAVGSGIGHKVFLNRTPVLGPRSRGGELGHWSVRGAATDGASSELGELASGRGVLAAARRTPGYEGLSSEALVAAFHAGDPAVIAVVDGAIAVLAQALAAVHLAVGVEHFVIVGGFAAALGEPYRRALARGAGTYCWDMGQDWNAMLQLDADDDDHGLIGAGAYAVLSGLAPPGLRGRSHGL
jgi:C7-cyclitol 7-kinase